VRKFIERDCASLSPKEHAHFVERDRPEPALELGAETQLVSTSEGMEQGLLQDIIRLVAKFEPCPQKHSQWMEVWGQQVHERIA